MPTSGKTLDRSTDVSAEREADEPVRELVPQPTQRASSAEDRANRITSRLRQLDDEHGYQDRLRRDGPGYSAGRGPGLGR